MDPERPKRMKSLDVFCLMLGLVFLFLYPPLGVLLIFLSILDYCFFTRAKSQYISKIQEPVDVAGDAEDELIRESIRDFFKYNPIWLWGGISLLASFLIMFIIGRLLV